MIFKGRAFAGTLCIYLVANVFLCIIDSKFIMPLFILTTVILAAAVIGKAALNKNTQRIIYFAAPIFVSVLYFFVMYAITEKPILTYLDTYKDTDVVIRAKINKITQGAFYTRLDLKVLEVNGKKAPYNFKLDLSVYDRLIADIDDVVETSVVFKSIEESTSMYGKPYGYFISAEHAIFEASTEENNIISGHEYEFGDEAEIEYETDGDYTEPDSVASDIMHTKAEKHGYRYLLDKLQVNAKNIFFDNIKIKGKTISGAFTQEAAIVYGIFTGNSSYIEQRVKTNFSKVGIAHILTVSGLNLSILTGLAFSLLTAFNVHKKVCCVFAILCCIAFMTFTGFSISVLRSGIMLILYYSAFLVSSKSDSLTSLFAAGTVLCVISPYNCLNIGFQLSFLATLGMVLSSEFNNRLASKIKIRTKIKSDAETKTITGSKSSSFIVHTTNGVIYALVSSLFMTFAATLFTLPVVSYNFKILSLISPVMNLITAPFITWILTLSIALLITSIIPSIAFIFGTPLLLLTKLVLYITTWGSSLKYACISVSSTKGNIFYIFSIILLITVILFFFFRQKNKVINIIMVSAMSASLILTASNLMYTRYIFKDSLRISYYSENKNQNILLFRGSGNKADIIDITDGTKGHVRATYNMILENGATDIDSIILTHYHKRYVDMIEKYLDYCYIDKIFVPNPKTKYDEEVFKMLFDFSVDNDGLYRKKFELYMYQDVLDFEDTAVIVNTFNYTGMNHMTIDIWRGNRKLLYLGIGYANMYEYIDNVYDVVLYGSHKHNRKDDDYGTNIYGTRYGVLSAYTDSFGGKSFQRLGVDALSAYDADKYSRLMYTDGEKYYVFEIDKKNDLKLYFLKREN